MLIRMKVHCGSENVLTFDKDVDTVDELKVAFLKRFGNIYDVPNKALKEKPLVKRLTYEAKSTPEWRRSLTTKTRWSIEIIKIGGTR